MSLLPPSPLLDETVTPGQSGHITDHDVIHHILNNLDTYAVQNLQGNIADRPGTATAGSVYWASDVKRGYRFDGADWWPLDHDNGAISGSDYGMTGVNTLDVKDNLQDLCSDAIADNRAVFIPPVDTPGAYHKVTGTIDLCEANTNAGIHIFGLGGPNRGLGQTHGSTEIANVSNTNPIFEFDADDHTNKLTQLYLEGLSLYGYGVRIKGGGGGTKLAADHCSFNAAGCDQAITMINAFWWRFFGCDLTAQDENYPAMRMIGESPTDEVVISYLVEMIACRLWNGGIWYEQNTDYSPNQSGGQFTLIDVDGEGFHATDSGIIVVMRGGGVSDISTVAAVTAVGVRHFDPVGATRVPIIRAADTGCKTVDVSMDACLYYGAAVVGQTTNVPTGIVSVNPGRDDPLVVDSAGTKINTLATKEKSGKRTYFGSTGTPTAFGLANRYGGDAFDRWGVTADGTTVWSDGTGGAKILPPRSGTPESNVVGSPGDLIADYTNGELYIKKSGTATNTGWKLVTHA